MRKALDDWRAEVGDMGEITESEMVHRWYPGGERPRTAPPIFVPICDESPGMKPSEGGEFEGPVLLQLHSATQGASIAYSLGQGDDARWLLYTVPIKLAPGDTPVRAKAIRIGYLESEEQQSTFTVNAVT
jgi:N-sulfoglucosamine sulfohydrolase